MRLKQTKEMELFRRAKEPERERELESQSLATRRTLMNEGAGCLGQDSPQEISGWGDFLANTLAKREAATARTLPILRLDREPCLLCHSPLLGP